MNSLDESVYRNVIVDPSDDRQRCETQRNGTSNPQLSRSSYLHVVPVWRPLQCADLFDNSVLAKDNLC